MNFQTAHKPKIVGKRIQLCSLYFTTISSFLKSLCFREIKFTKNFVKLFSQNNCHFLLFRLYVLVVASAKCKEEGSVGEDQWWRLWRSAAAALEVAVTAATAPPPPTLPALCSLHRSPLQPGPHFSLHTSTTRTRGSWGRWGAWGGSSWTRWQLAIRTSKKNYTTTKSGKASSVLEKYVTKVGIVNITVCHSTYPGVLICIYICYSPTLLRKKIIYKRVFLKH